MYMHSGTLYNRHQCHWCPANLPFYNGGVDKKSISCTCSFIQRCHLYYKGFHCNSKKDTNQCSRKTKTIASLQTTSLHTVYMYILIHHYVIHKPRQFFLIQYEQFHQGSQVLFKQQYAKIISILVLSILKIQPIRRLLLCLTIFVFRTDIKAFMSCIHQYSMLNKIQYNNNIVHDNLCVHLYMPNTDVYSREAFIRVNTLLMAILVLVYKSIHLYVQ